MSLTNSNRELTWRKSRRSTSNGACVEVARNNGMVIVRDSKNADGPTVRFTAAGWSAFLDRAKKGELDASGEGSHTAISGASLRNRFDTANLRDFLLYLISATTESDETLRRNLVFFRFVRSTIREVVAAVIIGSLLFGAGIAAAVTFGGMHLAVAAGIGAGGSATFILTAAIRFRRYLRAVLSALSVTVPHDTKTRPGTSEV
jgi:hypothetical protein